MDPVIIIGNSWKYRRGFLFAAAGFTAALMTAALLVQPDAAIATTIVISGFTLLGALVGTYVFGAVWDDK